MGSADKLGLSVKREIEEKRGEKRKSEEERVR